MRKKLTALLLCAYFLTACATVPDSTSLNEQPLTSSSQAVSEASSAPSSFSEIRTEPEENGPYEETFTVTDVSWPVIGTPQSAELRELYGEEIPLGIGPAEKVDEHGEKVRSEEITEGMALTITFDEIYVYSDGPALRGVSHVVVHDNVPRKSLPPAVEFTDLDFNNIRNDNVLAGDLLYYNKGQQLMSYSLSTGQTQEVLRGTTLNWGVEHNGTVAGCFRGPYGGANYIWGYLSEGELVEEDMLDTLKKMTQEEWVIVAMDEVYAVNLTLGEIHTVDSRYYYSPGTPIFSAQSKVGQEFLYGFSQGLPVIFSEGFIDGNTTHFRGWSNDAYPFDGARHWFASPVDENGTITIYYIVDDYVYFQESVGSSIGAIMISAVNEAENLYPQNITGRHIVSEGLLFDEATYWNGDVYYTRKDAPGIYSINGGQASSAFAMQLMPQGNYMFYIDASGQIGYITA